MPRKRKPFGWGKATVEDGLFPSVRDATVAVLNQVKGIVGDDLSIQSITFNVDTLEPPSVDLAIQSMLDQANSKIRFKCVASSVPEPDPRVSSARRDLWKFTRTKPVPAVAKPAELFRQACAEIVSDGKDHLESWGRTRGRSAEFSVDQIDSILAVMVFPPANTSGFEASEWVRRIQLTAAQLSANVEKRNGVAIADSKLNDVTKGPLDWTIDAAMVALAQRANEEPGLAGEVREVVRRVAARVPVEGTWSCGVVAKRIFRYLESDAMIQRADKAEPQRGD